MLCFFRASKLNVFFRHAAISLLFLFYLSDLRAAISADAKIVQNQRRQAAANTGGSPLMFFKRASRSTKAMVATRLFEQLESRELFSAAPLDVAPPLDLVPELVSLHEQQQQVPERLSQMSDFSIPEHPQLTSSDCPLAMVVNAGEVASTELGARLRLSNDVLGEWKDIAMPSQWSLVSGPGTRPSPMRPM